VTVDVLGAAIVSRRLRGIFVAVVMLGVATAVIGLCPGEHRWWCSDFDRCGIGEPSETVAAGGWALVLAMAAFLLGSAFLVWRPQALAMAAWSWPTWAIACGAMYVLARMDTFVGEVEVLWPERMMHTLAMAMAVLVCPGAALAVILPVRRPTLPGAKLRS
jgi:hypothetical protein